MQYSELGNFATVDTVHTYITNLIKNIKLIVLCLNKYSYI